MVRKPSPKQVFLAELASGQHGRYAKYTPDYAWRAYRGDQSGLTRSQARGHARLHKGEIPVSVLRAKVTTKKFDRTQHRTVRRSFRYLDQIPGIVLTHALDAFSVYVIFGIGDGTKERYYTESKLLDQPDDELMEDLYDGENGINFILAKYNIRKRFADGDDVWFEVVFRDDIG